MGLGKARNIRVKQIVGNTVDVQREINTWLAVNQNLEVIDIKFVASATHDEWGNDALIIYFNSEEEQ